MGKTIRFHYIRFSPLITLISVLFFLFSCVSLNGAIIVKEVNNMDYSTFDEFMLTDTYDTKDSTFGEFLATDDAYDIMARTYDLISNNQKIDYYEIGFQSIEFLDSYNGKSSTINGGDESRNQKIADETITPLNSMQLSEKSMMEKKFNQLASYEHFNSFFRSTETSSNLHIPAVVGHSYDNFFNVGDTFGGKYLNKSFIFHVVEELPKDFSIRLLSEDENLNDYIIIPSMSIDNSDEAYSKKLLSVKCEGIVHYETEEDYKTSIDAISEIVNETSFKYYIPDTRNSFKNVLGLSISTSILMLVISVILLTTSAVSFHFFMKAKGLIMLENLNVKQRKIIMILVNSMVIIIIFVFSALFLRLILVDFRVIVDEMASRLTSLVILWCLIASYFTIKGKYE